MTYLSLHSQRQSQVSNQDRWNQSFSPLHSAVSSSLPMQLKSVKISRKVKMQSYCSGDISSQNICHLLHVKYKTAFKRKPNHDSMYSQTASVLVDSTHMDSDNFRSKIFQTISRNFQKQNLNLQ